MKLSIVAAYNQKLDMTKDFLQCMYDTTKTFREENELEFILVNGGNTIDLEHPIITKLIRLEKNHGFSLTVNEGLRQVATDSEYIFYVGNDSFPTYDGWLEDLITLQKDTGAGIVCPSNDRPGLNAYKHLYQSETEFYYNVEFFPSIAYLITKECFDKVGLWDTLYINSGMYGDNDYCARVRLAGETIIVSKNILLKHLLSQESPKLFNIDFDMAENHKRYLDKWSKGIPPTKVWY